MSLLLDALKKAAKERAERDRQQAEDITRHREALTQTRVDNDPTPVKQAPQSIDELESGDAPLDSDETQLYLEDEFQVDHANPVTPVAEGEDDTALDFTEALQTTVDKPSQAASQPYPDEATETRLELELPAFEDENTAPSLSAADRIEARSDSDDTVLTDQQAGRGNALSQNGEQPVSTSDAEAEETHLELSTEAPSQTVPQAYPDETTETRLELPGFEDDNAAPSLSNADSDEEQSDGDDTALNVQQTDLGNASPQKVEPPVSTSVEDDTDLSGLELSASESLNTDTPPSRPAVEAEETNLDLSTEVPSRSEESLILSILSDENDREDTTMGRHSPPSEEGIDRPNTETGADRQAPPAASASADSSDTTELKLEPDLLDDYPLIDDEPSQVRHPHRQPTAEDDTSMVLHEEDVTSFFGDETFITEASNDAAPHNDATHSDETTASYADLSIEDDASLLASLKDATLTLTSPSVPNQSEETDTFSIPQDMPAWQIQAGKDQANPENASDSGSSTQTIDVEHLTDAQLATTFVSHTERTASPPNQARASDNYDRTVFNLPADITKDLKDVKSSENPQVMTPSSAKKVFQTKSNRLTRKNYRLYAGVAVVILLSLMVISVFMYLQQSQLLDSELVRYQRDPAPPQSRQTDPAVTPTERTDALLDAPKAAELIAEAEGRSAAEVAAELAAESNTLPIEDVDRVEAETQAITDTPNVEQLERLAQDEGLTEPAQVETPSISKAEKPAVTAPAVAQVKPLDVPKDEPPKPKAVQVSKQKQQPVVPTPIAIKKVEPQQDSVKLRLDQAYELYQNGLLGQARNNYQSVLSEEPRNLDALLGLAALDVREQRYSSAIRSYQQVLEQEPAHAEAQTALLSLLPLQPDQAETQLRLLLQKNPGASYIHFNLGNTLASQGRWSEAQQEYFSALQAAPTNGDYAYNLAVSLEHLSKSTAAVPYYRQALKSYQSDVNSYNPDLVRQRLNVLESL